MTRESKLDRNTIVRTVVDSVKPLDYVHALWEGGAAAFRLIDEWSDIDLYLVADDDKSDQAFLAVEKALRSLCSITQKYRTPQLPWPGVTQAFYRLERADKYLLIDLAVLKLSSPDKFLEPEIHGNNVFHFNKSDKIKSVPVDTKVFAEKLHHRLKELQARFDMFNVFIQKEINRGNTLEAFHFYYNFTLAFLVEALRIKHGPLHHDFRPRYVHHELPHEIIKKLEHLYFVKDLKDLQTKYLEANEWFLKTMPEISTAAQQYQSKHFLHNAASEP